MVIGNMPRNGISGNGRFDRRNALKIIGATALGGLGATTSAAATQYKPRVIRIKGSYSSPIEPDEVQDAFEKLVAKSPTTDSSALDTRAISKVGDGYEHVEYVARTGPNGRLTQYYGASSAAEEAAAHAKGRAKVAEFETSEVTTSSTPPVESGPDWNFVNDDQANVTAHFGELNHNIEWYRVREDDDEERNAFRTLIASSDDTINPYAREILAEHDWSESELGNEDIHAAGPSTTHDDGYTVSIGYPSGGTLSWEDGGSGDVQQNLTNDGPVVDWSYEIPQDGTSWFYPGSHVVSNRANCWADQKVVTTEAEAIWGDLVTVYDLGHRWQVTTKTC